MPGLTTNLVSLGKLCDDGLIVVLTESKLAAYPAAAVTVKAATAPAVEGLRNATTRMWDIPLDGGQPRAFIARVEDPLPMVNNIVAAQNMEQLAIWYHRALFSPRPSTFLKAISRGHFRTWPGLTEQLIKKHLPPSVHTAQGHMKKIRQGRQSTKRHTFAGWTFSP